MESQRNFRREIFLTTKSKEHPNVHQRKENKIATQHQQHSIQMPIILS